MSQLSRLRYLEAQLEREDLTDLQFRCYNDEANAIQDDINKRRKIQDELRAARLKEEQEERELEKVMALTEEQVDKMYEDSCLKYQDVNGMSFRDWYAQSLKYYTIDANNVVHSRARSPNTVDSVPCHTLAQAKLRILILIRTKFNDHAVRGYDFAWEI